MPAAEPQDILTPITEDAVFLTACVDPGGEAVILDALPELAGLRRSVGFRYPDAQLSSVVGIGAALWDRLFDGPRPAGLHPFRELRGERHTAPATPGDLFFHIRASRMDVCFEAARLIVDRLGPQVRIVDEVHGFRSFDLRDLLGFVDGTENPEGQAAAAAVLIGAEDADFAGGSYVIVQKYVHDLEGWNELTVEQQEAAFGRTKLDDVEFPDEDKAPDSHLALNVIEDDDGEELEVMRFNMPFGRVGAGEYGTYYVAYAASPAVTEEMLDNMFLGKGTATHDRILDFSTALTGNLFFVPSADFLDGPPVGADGAGEGEAAPAEGDADATAGADVAAAGGSAAAGEDAAASGDAAAGGDAEAAGDGSLGIGALRDDRAR